jgi:purine-nucleoside/S-methyl-5'-thioadenosine phosphorylase / adenosine deaminase
MPASRKLRSRSAPPRKAKKRVREDAPPKAEGVKQSRRWRGLPSSASAAPHNWSERIVAGVGVLQVPAFAKIPWLVHGFSTVQGGGSDLDGNRILNLGFTDWDTRRNVLHNRQRFQSALGAADFSLAPLKQIHSDLVRRLDAPANEAVFGDAAVTDQPRLLLAVQTADCVPILLVDTKKRAVAAVHAGWRGTIRRITAKAVGQMRMHFGSEPADLLAAIGPAIGNCCYEVGTEIGADFLSQFADAPDFFDEFRTGDEPNPVQWLNQMPPGHQPPAKNVLLDLHRANESQLKQVGVQVRNISVSNLCTACRPDLLFSYRKQGAKSGRMMAAIGIRK